MVDTVNYVALLKIIQYTKALGKLTYNIYLLSVRSLIFAYLMRNVIGCTENQSFGSVIFKFK